MGRKRANTIDVKIIWQSKRFPWMTFTDIQLDVFRERYPRIAKWKPFLEQLEAWVATNAACNREKIPTPRGWGNFLNHCARRMNKDIEIGRRKPDGTLCNAKSLANAEYYYQKPEGGNQKLLTRKSEAMSIEDILRKVNNDRTTTA
jgi:hypothetical protein